MWDYFTTKYLVDRNSEQADKANRPYEEESSSTVSCWGLLHRFKPDTVPALRGGNEHEPPSLTKKLSSSDICPQRESHCVSTQHFSPSPAVDG